MQKEITIVIVFCEDKPNLVFKCLEKIKNFNIIIVNNIGNTFFRININKILLKI
mgnify:FL=1|jgi:hypothetical protein